LHLIIVVQIPSENSRNHFRHILPIHNLTINCTDFFFVNFRWTFNFCVEKSYDGTHLAFGGTLDRRCHIKNTSHLNKAGSTTVKWAWLTDKGSRLAVVLLLCEDTMSSSIYTWCIFTFRTSLVRSSKILQLQ
jgi:hypothetical protein